MHSLDNCPEEVRGKLNELTSGAGSILGGNLRGVYLHGSLAIGCFNPRRSDLDVLAITRDRPGRASRRALMEFLVGLPGPPGPLELSVLHTNQFTPWCYPTPFDFHFGDEYRDEFEKALRSDEWENSWNERPDTDLAAHFRMTRERGIALTGEPIEGVFPGVPFEDCRDSLLADLWWAFDRRQASPGYGVLNSCRICAFVEAEHIFSKAEGGRWALAEFPDRYHEAVNLAMEDYIRDDAGEFPEAPVLALMEYVIERLGAKRGQEGDVRDAFSEEGARHRGTSKKQL